MSELLAIVTIGRTAAEVIAAELACHPDIALLPGQNFSGSGTVLYRPHDYSGMEANEIFDRLLQHCYGRVEEKAWLGLTKSMTHGELTRYLESDHRTLFAKMYRGDYRFLMVAEDFARSYFEAFDIDHESPRFVGFFTNNAPVWLTSDDLIGTSVRFLDWRASPLLWLALISENLTWNAELALKWWIVFRLCFKEFERKWPQRFLSANLDEYLSNPTATVNAVLGKLGLPCWTAGKSKEMPSGFIKIDRDRLDSLLPLAGDIGSVLKGNRFLKIAQEFDTWSDQFLDNRESTSLLHQFRRYWTSTSHIAFDISGPIEDQIIEHAARHLDIRESKSITYQVFHEMVSMTSRTFNVPKVTVTHGLGHIEEDLIIPCAPYYLRAAIAYLLAVLESYVYDPWTFQDIRRSPIFLRLNHEPYVSAFDRFGLSELRGFLDQRIDYVASQIAKSHAASRSLRIPVNSVRGEE